MIQNSFNDLKNNTDNKFEQILKEIQNLNNNKDKKKLI